MLLYVDAHCISPYAMAAFVALHEKGITFALERVDLAAGDNFKPDFAATSLTQRIPTLVHGAFTLSESSAITEYLDETCGGRPLYPTDAKARARARQIQAWLRSDLMPIRNERPTEVIFYGKQYAPLSVEAQQAADKLFYAANSILKPGQANLLGQWSIADTELALMLNRLIMHGDAVPQPLVEYAARQWEHPSVQLWLQEKRPASPPSST